jgi:ribonucleoside-diphosphate reductase subunit M2
MLLHVASYIINFLLQATAALAALTLESPTKPSKKDVVILIDDEKRWQSLESVINATNTLPDFHRKFVGEVDLPES